MAVNIVELQKARIGMTKALQSLSTQTTALEKALKGNANPEWTKAVKTLRGVLKDANTKVVESLDEALNMQHDSGREGLYAMAWRESSNFLQTVKKNKLLAQIENNEILPVPAVSALTSALTKLTNALR